VVPEKALNGFEGRIDKPIGQVKRIKDGLEGALEVKVL
jgi:hypothetical protein